MCIRIPYNKRHFVVAYEEVLGQCVVTSTMAATWRNVDIVDVQLLAIGHCNRYALLFQMRIGRVVDEGDYLFDLQ